MYYREGIPAHLLEDGSGSAEDGTDCSLDSEAEEDAYDSVAYAKTMEWAQEKEVFMGL
jgi:hypothetical protein